MPRLKPLMANPRAYDFDDRCEEFLPEPELSGADTDLFPPITTSSAERLSFLRHSVHINRKDAPVDLNGIHATCESIYAAARWAYSKESVPEQVRKAVLQIDRKTSPGYPLCLTYPTNGDLLEAVGVEAVVDMVLTRIKDYLRDGPDAADPVRVFVKHELHTRKKMREGRMRLIWSISVVDAIVDSFLFDPSLRSEILHHTELPCQPGLSFSNGGMVGLFRRLSACRGPFAAADKSLWDWTVAAWEYDFDCEARRRLCSNWAEVPSDVKQLWYIRYYALSKCRMMFSDGVSYQQMFRGIMKSGSKLTISMNSRLQLVLKLCYLKKLGIDYDASKHLLVSMGDDTLEAVFGLDLADYGNFLTLAGHILKRWTSAPDLFGLDFCSLEFRNHPFCGPVVVSNNWAKCLANLWLAQSNDFENIVGKLRQYCEMFCFDDEKFQLLHRFLSSLEPTAAMSLEYYRYHVTGNEGFYQGRVRQELLRANLRSGLGEIPPQKSLEEGSAKRQSSALSPATQLPQKLSSSQSRKLSVPYHTTRQGSLPPRGRN